MMRIFFPFNLLQTKNKKGMQKASVIVRFSVLFFLLSHHHRAESFSFLAKFSEKESHDNKKVAMSVASYPTFSFLPCLIECQLYINMMTNPTKLFYMPVDNHYPKAGKKKKRRMKRLR